MQLLYSSISDFLITIGCISLLRPLAIRIGLVDTPHGRKQHSGHVPLIGGIAMLLGFLFALLTLPVSLQPYRSFIAGSALLVFVGVLDDFHELSAKARFVAQALSALIMVLWGKVALHNLGNLLFLGDIHLGFFSIPITIIAVIGIINAVNMTDGVDGLAGGLALIELAALLFLAKEDEVGTQIKILALTIAGLIGFLWFNFRFPWRKQALVFMGDAGSMFLGFTLVWFLVDLSQGQHKLVAPAVMLWIMALPLFDIIGVMLRRLQKRQSVFSPDREHLHYLLKDVGFTTPQVTLTLCGIAAIFALVGILFDKMQIAEGVIFFSFLIMFGIYLWSLRYLRNKINNNKVLPA